MKKGFTLAEILITLGVIGVVAALTIPTLNVSTKEKSLDAKLKVCVSDMENALTTMMATEGATDLDETKAFADGEIIDNLQKYIKIYKTSDTKFTMKNGAEIEFSTKKPYQIKDANDSEISADDYTSICSFDINGTEKPNIKDIDQFDYAALKTGLLTKIGEIKEGPNKERPRR